MYTLRGRFRQFFLRVSADNEDKWDSANIVVTPQRTLEVFVEEVRLSNLVLVAFDIGTA